MSSVVEAPAQHSTADRREEERSGQDVAIHEGEGMMELHMYVPFDVFPSPDYTNLRYTHTEGATDIEGTATYMTSYNKVVVLL